MDPKKNTLMAVLSYLGPLVIVSFIVAKDDPFAKFHIKQGLVLLVIWVVISILQSTMWQFWMLYQLLNLGVFILAIVGIINAAQGKEQDLPLVGQFAKYFTF